MKGNFRRGLKHYTSVFLTVALIFGQIVPVSASTEAEIYDLISDETAVTEEGFITEDESAGLAVDKESILEEPSDFLQDELTDDIQTEDTLVDYQLDEPLFVSENSVLEEGLVLSDDNAEVELLSDAQTDISEDLAEENTEYAVSYDNNAVATADQLRDYPGVYRVKAKKSENGIMTIGIPSLAQLAKPTTESPAIIMGAAVPYEKKTGPTEYTPITGGALYAPYSYFRYKIIEEANLNGTGGFHRKMSGFDGTYVIIRVDVSDIIKDAPVGSYLHVKQSHNKALMVLLGQDVSEGIGTFSDAGGNKTYTYSLSDNALVMKDKDGNDKETPYLDVVVMSSGTLVQGADTGSTPDPKAPTADFDLSFYIDSTDDYAPNIEWNTSLGTAVYKDTGKAITITEEETAQGITASDKVLAKYFDETKAGSNKISKYKVKGSDIELEMMVENEENAATESGKTEYWSLKKSMEYDKYNGHALKLICEAPLLDSISVKGNPNSNPKRNVILDVNSFDIQLANHSTTGAAALMVDGATLTIQDTFNTTGAELAVGNNAKMEIKNKGRFIIADSAQLEIEYDAASVSVGSASEPSYDSGVINVNTGGVIENRGIITVEGKEGKPQNAGDVVVRDYKNAKMTIDNGGTLENYGCLLVNGEFYNLGTVKNYGKYDDTITSNDPDKGIFTYHKGIQLSWKDDITQGHTFAGEMYNGIDDIGTVYNTAQIINEGDFVMVPGYLENYGKIDNKGNIYMSPVDEVVIPITALADKPLITEKRVRLGYFENSMILNDQGAVITNSGRISPADIAVVSNGRTGTLSANINRNPGGLNIRGYGSVMNTGTINIDALYTFSTVTNKGEGAISKVFLCHESNYSGKLTESSKNKTKVYNGAKSTSGSTDTWTYAGLDSLMLENRIIKEPVECGKTVKWRFRAETSNTGKDIVFRIKAMMLSPYKEIESFELPANKTVEIESPKLPDITGNSVYFFYAELAQGDGSAVESASVKVKGTGLIKPTAMQNLVYNGQAQELVTAGSYEGGKVQYKLSGETGYSDSIPQVKNAGNYTVDYKTQDGKYSGSIEVTIGKKKAFIAADDVASKKGSDIVVPSLISYGVIGNDLGSIALNYNPEKNIPGIYDITVNYSENVNYDVKVYNGTYTVMDTTSSEAPEIKAQAVIGEFDNVASTISVNYVYNPSDKGKTATVYYSLSQNLTSSNYNINGTTTAPTFGGMGDQLIYYYVHTPDGAAGGCKPVVKTEADQKAPDSSKFTVDQAIKGMGITLSGCEARKTEYRRADEENYTMAMSDEVYGFRGTYYVRYAGDGVHYNSSPDIKIVMPEEKTVTAYFDCNGGTPVSATVSGLIYGDKINKPQITPVKDGYRFVNWFSDKECTEEYDFESLVTEADIENKITIYAKWAKVIPDASDDDSDAIRKDVGDDKNIVIDKSTSGKISSNIVTVSGSKISEVKTDEDGKVIVNSQIWVGGLLDSYKYSGVSIKPEIHVYDGVKKLTEKTDYTLAYRNNKNAGRVGSKNTKGKSTAPTIVLKFKGNYQGNATRYIEFNIDKAVLGEDVIVHDLSVAVLKKNKAQKPTPVITMVSTGKTLSAKLFDISYSQTVSAAGIPYKVTVKSKNGSNFSNQTDANITVVSDKNLMMDKAKVSVKPNSYVYTGQPIIPAYSAYTIKIGRNVLRPDVDYVVKDIYNNTEPGTATVVFAPAPGSRYVGTKAANFKIKNGRAFNSFTKSTFKYSYSDSVPYIKGGAMPEVKVYDRGIQLKEKVDYTVVYRNNKTVAVKNAVNKKGKDISPQIIIKGKGKYKGSIRLPFGIVKQDINNLKVIGADQFLDMTKYMTKYRKAKITIIDVDGKKLGNKDFAVIGNPAFSGTVSKNNVTVTVSVNGIGNYKGMKNVTFHIMDKTRNIANAKIMNKIQAQYYTGNEITLSRNDLKNVLYTGKKSAPNYLNYTNNKTVDDFEIIDYTNNIKKGTAKVTVRGINKYAGTKTISFKIVQKKAGFRGILIGGKWR